MFINFGCRGEALDVKEDKRLKTAKEKNKRSVFAVVERENYPNMCSKKQWIYSSFKS